MDGNFTKHKKLLTGMVAALEAAEKAEQSVTDLQQTKTKLTQEVMELSGRHKELLSVHEQVVAELAEKDKLARSTLAAVRQELMAQRQTQQTELEILEAAVTKVRDELTSLTAVRDNLKTQLHSAAEGANG